MIGLQRGVKNLTESVLPVARIGMILQPSSALSSHLRFSRHRYDLDSHFLSKKYENLEDGEAIEWQSDGLRYRYEVDLEYLNRGKAVIAEYAKFPVPMLALTNGFSMGNPLTIVKLKSN